MLSVCRLNCTPRASASGLKAAAVWAASDLESTPLNQLVGSNDRGTDQGRARREVVRGAGL
jgi:hypothetical protein